MSEASKGPDRTVSADGCTDSGNGVVVAFRPRDQVPPLIRGFRSAPPKYRFWASAPMRIEGSVIFVKLLRGLASEGLTFMRDERTGELVICPDPEAQS